MFVIFDLDGTLACCEHRAHHIAEFELVAAGDCAQPLRREPDWDAFYRASVHDTPILPILNVMRALREAGARVEIWTGRSDLVKSETEEWFARHGVPRVPMLMRPHGDHTEDHELKRQWLYRLDAPPDLVFEDRARVVSMWREEGIRCCQVAPGLF